MITNIMGVTIRLFVITYMLLTMLYNFKITSSVNKLLTLLRELLNSGKLLFSHHHSTVKDRNIVPICTHPMTDG